MISSFPVLDTHTGGELTRVVMASDIGLDDATVVDQLDQLRGRLDWVRKTLTSEPRGSAFAVGAVVTPPSKLTDPSKVVFFNNVGYLGMCGHGLLGVVEALRHRGLITAGRQEFATPPGRVVADLADDHSVDFTGVRSHCYRQDVSVSCEDGRVVVGDIAYGGNWFFLTRDDGIAAAATEDLETKCQHIRDAIEDAGFCGADEEKIDHIELYCPLPTPSPESLGGHERGCLNFVLCPGGHYDRSPCGTGTSAKLACLAARGEIEPGEPWIQESVTKSRFIAFFRQDAEGVRVTIKGRAHVIAETIQVFDPDDPLRHGLMEQIR